MKKQFAHGALALVICACAGAAFGQQVYRCGKTYSQIPCPGAKVIDTRDNRTKQQRTDSRKATARDTTLANDLEKARQQEEAMAAAGSTPVEKPPKAKASKSESKKANSNKAKKKEPELFTAAAAPPEKKKKKAAAPPP